jgi:hypothetical protein
MSNGEREPSTPGHRVTRLARRGADSKSWGCKPASVRHSAAYSAAARSPGPSSSPVLVVSMRMSSDRSLVTDTDVFVVTAIPCPITDGIITQA